jgi:hypothetical protein
MVSLSMWIAIPIRRCACGIVVERHSQLSGGIGDLDGDQVRAGDALLAR